MKIGGTAIAGCLLADLEARVDDRGFFARTFCVDEFEKYGVTMNIMQEGMSYNRRKGTVRGLHFDSNGVEAKLVRCSRGAIYDVVVDIRRDSPTFGSWIGVGLDERNRRAVYIPAGCAHGFQTLVDDTDVMYSMSTPYDATRPRGIRWDDDTFNVTWPMAVAAISAADRSLPKFREINE